MRSLTIAVFSLLVVSIVGFLYSSGMLEGRAEAPLPVPPIPPPQWHVIAGYFAGDEMKQLRSDRDFDRAIECLLAAATINQTWLVEDQLGVATCRQ